MSRSSEPAPTGTEQPTRGVKPGRSEGPREAERIVSPSNGARGRWRLRHPDPLELEGGVGVPECTPHGVIAKEKRRSSACSSERAGTLQPAITSHQVSPEQGLPRSSAPVDHARS